MTVAYPLQWPPGFPRAKYQEPGRFKTTLGGALKNVETSLRLFGTDSGKKVAGIVLSSNVTLGTSKPADPGVAAYFTWDDLQVCIPVDRYSTVEGNLQAIHHIIEARRIELRHGTLSLVRASMQGFAALPAPGSTPWWQILQVKPEATRAEIDSAYRKLARERHPDAGGSEAMMSDLNVARDAGLKQARAP